MPSRSEAEALPLAGTARVQTVASGSNGSSDASGTVKDVGYIGNGAGNTLSIWDKTVPSASPQPAEHSSSETPPPTDPTLTP
ncbi:hypothetical protein [Arthrobacter sp. B2a2-09]|uniref:hypothetical protein n=1 Tax=Arthrobacter sp. B2a2-09 TaxID=2952822 RepID=UPI0022CD3491|nr:hypothetical protein [Arthrobacter sp. B2a2-09]MCZ9881691.1 hypothetical protein [Arthrobacter sp. B2a2-09]